MGLYNIEQMCYNMYKRYAGLVVDRERKYIIKGELYEGQRID